MPRCSVAALEQRVLCRLNCDEQLREKGRVLFFGSAVDVQPLLQIELNLELNAGRGFLGSPAVEVRSKMLVSLTPMRLPVTDKANEFGHLRGISPILIRAPSSSCSHAVSILTSTFSIIFVFNSFL